MHSRSSAPARRPRFVHLPRRQRRVAVDAIELIAQVAKRVVLQLVRQLTRPARRRSPTRARTAVPARRAPVVQPRLIVGIEVGRPDPASEMKGDARHSIAARGGSMASSAANLGGERRRDPLVGVEREDPVVARPGRRRSSSDRRSRSRRGSPRGRPSAARWRRVSSVLPRVDDDDLVGPGGAVDGAAIWAASLSVMMVTE